MCQVPPQLYNSVHFVYFVGHITIILYMQISFRAQNTFEILHK